MRKYGPALDQEENASWKHKMKQREQNTERAVTASCATPLFFWMELDRAALRKNGTQTCNPTTGGRTNTKGDHSKVIQCF